jgi:hypothetical protein
MKKGFGKNLIDGMQWINIHRYSSCDIATHELADYPNFFLGGGVGTWKNGPERASDKTATDFVSSD